MVFNNPKAGPLSCVTSPVQKEKIKIVILSILNVLDTRESVFIGNQSNVHYGALKNGYF